MSCIQVFKNALPGGTGSDKFFIGDMAGLYLRKSLDYEVTQTHDITIVVTDQGLLPQQQATSNILVTVQDVNDNMPVRIIYNYHKRLACSRNIEHIRRRAKSVIKCLVSEGGRLFSIACFISHR